MFQKKTSPKIKFHWHMKHSHQFSTVPVWWPQCSTFSELYLIKFILMRQQMWEQQIYTLLLKTKNTLASSKSFHIRPEINNLRWENHKNRRSSLQFLRPNFTLHLRLCVDNSSFLPFFCHNKRIFPFVIRIREKSINSWYVLRVFCDT